MLSGCWVDVEWMGSGHKYWHGVVLLLLYGTRASQIRLAVVPYNKTKTTLCQYIYCIMEQQWVGFDSTLFRITRAKQPRVNIYVHSPLAVKWNWVGSLLDIHLTSTRHPLHIHLTYTRHPLDIHLTSTSYPLDIHLMTASLPIGQHFITLGLILDL